MVHLRGLRRLAGQSLRERLSAAHSRKAGLVLPVRRALRCARKRCPPRPQPANISFRSAIQLSTSASRSSSERSGPVPRVPSTRPRRVSSTRGVPGTPYMSPSRPGNVSTTARHLPSRRSLRDARVAGLRGPPPRPFRGVNRLQPSRSRCAAGVRRIVSRPESDPANAPAAHALIFRCAAADALPRRFRPPPVAGARPPAVAAGTPPFSCSAPPAQRRPARGAHGEGALTITHP